MHDTERDPFLPQPAAPQSDPAAGGAVQPAGRKQAQPAAKQTAKTSFGRRILQFLAHLLGAKKQPLKEMNAAQRVSALRTAQSTPPVTFKGDTTSTLATPMGAYAGKPLEQALRKRAEQQFAMMDITQTTMH